MEQPAGKRLSSRSGVLQIALHNDIAAEHELAHRLAVRRRRFECLGVSDEEIFLHLVFDALTCLQCRLLLDRQGTPFRMPVTNSDGPVNFGESIGMRDVEAEFVHALEYGCRRSGACRHDLNPSRQIERRRLRGVEQQVHDDRCTAQVRHVVIANRIENGLGLDAAQTDMRTSHRGDRPREAPSVAVKHRKRPQIDGPVGHAPRENVTDRVHIGAAMVVNDAFGISCRSGCVVERDSVPFVLRQRPGVLRVTFVEQLLIIQLAEQFPGGRERVIDVDNQRLVVQTFEGCADDRRELAIRDKHLRLSMTEDERNRLCIEADIQSVEHCATHRYTEVSFQKRRDVGRHHGDRISLADSARN